MAHLNFCFVFLFVVFTRGCRLFRRMIFGDGAPTFAEQIKVEQLHRLQEPRKETSVSSVHRFVFGLWVVCNVLQPDIAPTKSVQRFQNGVQETSSKLAMNGHPRRGVFSCTTGSFSFF